MPRRSVRFSDERRRRTSPAFHICLKFDPSWPASDQSFNQNKRNLIVAVGVDTAGRAASSYDCQNLQLLCPGIVRISGMVVRTTLNNINGLWEVRILPPRPTT